MADRGAVQRFNWAGIIEKFGALPAHIGALTDAQLHGLIHHKRDKDGILVPPDDALQPEPPAVVTDDTRLAQIAMLEAAKLITAENAAALREQIKNGHTPR